VTQNLHSLLGLLALLGLAWAFSEQRRAVRLRIGAVGALVQLALAALFLNLPPLKRAFAALNEAVLVLQRSTESGATFVFGYLAGGPLPFEETQPGASFILAYRALPLVMVVSALTALLVYWRVLPLIVRALSLVLEKSLRVGGAVGLSTAANVFVGMVEAPLFIRPYLRLLTRAELFMVMCAGMASIAGTVLILYATIVGPLVPDAIGHLLAASVISAPAAITVAQIMVPETGRATGAELVHERGAESAMDAIATGTRAGLELYLQIVAMLLVLVALVHLVNSGLALLPPVAGTALTLERLLGYLMAPVTWLMGIPWAECRSAGALMGIKTALNELLAYLELSRLAPDALSTRSELIMTYALCGFANFGSLGIMIGGLTTLAPERREEIIGLGLKSIVGGTLATCCTGAAVGAVYGW
jgi:CNT family concentrative nucleoside transporter